MSIVRRSRTFANTLTETWTWKLCVVSFKSASRSRPAEREVVSIMDLSETLPSRKKCRAIKTNRRSREPRTAKRGSQNKFPNQADYVGFRPTNQARINNKTTKTEINKNPSEPKNKPDRHIGHEQRPLATTSETNLHDCLVLAHNSRVPTKKGARKSEMGGNSKKTENGNSPGINFCRLKKAGTLTFIYVLIEE